MKLSLTTVAFLVVFSFKTLADTPAKVLIPFGDAAIWAAGLSEVQDCKDAKCDEEMKYGVPLALTYALNNARLAIKHGKDADEVKIYLRTIDKLLIELEKLEEKEQGQSLSSFFIFYIFAKYRIFIYIIIYKYYLNID